MSQNAMQALQQRLGTNADELAFLENWMPATMY